jgi:hypothetical protein
MTQTSETYASPAERAAAVEDMKRRCRAKIAELELHYPGQVTALFQWIDGVWGDYWHVMLNGESAGDLYYDSFCVVPKGDKLNEMIATIS